MKASFLTTKQRDRFQDSAVQYSSICGSPGLATAIPLRPLRFSRPCVHHPPRHGFTLIELLASMTILAIIIGLLALTLDFTTDTWHSSQNRARLLAQGRAVLDGMAQDLRQSVAGTNLFFTGIADTNASFVIGADDDSYGATNNGLGFFKLLVSPGTNRACEAVVFGILPTNGIFRLTRTSQRFQTGTDAPGPTNIWILADTLAALRFTPPGGITNAESSIEFASLPRYVDIYLELLDDDDARAAAALSDVRQRSFVERRAIRLTQRVYLPTANRWDLP